MNDIPGPSTREIRINLIKAEIKSASSAAVSMMKWFISSLLVINGAALAAIIRVAEFNPRVLSYADLFCMSMLAGLVGGLFFGLGASAIGMKMADGLWTEKILDEKGISINYHRMMLGPALTWSGFALAIVSGILFALACHNFSHDFDSGCKPVLHSDGNALGRIQSGPSNC